MATLLNSGADSPTTIGPFQILGTLGVGGLGAVYLGERTEPFVQRVAIKVLHPDLFPRGKDTSATDGLAREEQILASLNHENIVRLLDQGVSSAHQRYIVMEFVDGLQLDRFCDVRHLSIDDRLRLLLQVTAAVSYAHRHLVVHADLKPANVLVNSDGQAKLLDFGIASLLREEAPRAAAAPAYTPLFASPEQRAGKAITVASDIYALGLLASIVLAGYNPAASPDEHDQLPSRAVKKLDRATQKEIAEARHTNPGALVNALCGDLDAILLKALRPVPNERYLTVEAFSDDLRNHLEGRPIQARPSTRSERFRKWVHRNRIAAAAVALLVAAIIFSAVGVVLQAAHVAHERRIAQARLHELIRLTSLLEGELYDSVQPLQGSESARAFLTQTATSTLDKLAADNRQDPALQIELAQQYDKLAHIEVAAGTGDAAARQRALGDVDKGLALLAGRSGDNKYFSEETQQELAQFRSSLTDAR